MSKICLPIHTMCMIFLKIYRSWRAMPYPNYLLVCMRSEGYGSYSVCLFVCVCLSVSHISPLGLLFIVKTLPRTQRATKVKRFVAFSLNLICWRDWALPPLDGHTYGRPFLLWITCVRIVHTQVLQGSRCDAWAPCRKLFLCSSFTMMESSN